MCIKIFGSENIFHSIELNKKYWAERGVGGGGGGGGGVLELPTVHPCIYGHGGLLQSPTIRDGMVARRVWDQEWILS